MQMIVKWITECPNKPPAELKELKAQFEATFVDFCEHYAHTYFGFTPNEAKRKSEISVMLMTEPKPEPRAKRTPARVAAKKAEPPADVPDTE